MGRRKKDYTGLVFGKLKVTGLHIELSRLSNRGVWSLVCECGNTINKSSSDIRKLVDNSSCGCSLKRKRHKYVHYTVIRPSMEKVSSHSSWEAMKQRCLNPNNTHYDYYGGRGISVCEKWLNFWDFYEDMGERPTGLTLDRIDTNLGYFKENCRWTTRSEQSYNTRTQRNNTSGKSGVSWSNKDKRWVAVIEKDGVVERLGCFINKEDAIHERKVAEIRTFGYNVP